MKNRVLLIEPGDEATRRYMLESLASRVDIEIIVASGIFSSSKNEWFEPFTNEFVSFSYEKIEHLVEEAKTRGVGGVVTYFDLCLGAAQAVARCLDLPLIFAGQETLGRKDVQRRLLAEKGVRTAKFVKIDSDREILADVLEYVGLPCVVKPVQFTSSLGVKVCSTLREVNEAVVNARTCDFWDENVRNLMSNVSNSVLIEEFLSGEEISVEGYCFEGKYQLIGLTRKLRSEHVILDELGHVFPHPYISIHSETGLKISKYMEEVHSALGVLNSFTHAEVILKTCDSEPVLIELNCRPAGGYIPYLIESVLNLNVPGIMIDIALGHCPEIKVLSHEKTFSTLYVYTKNEGRLVSDPLWQVDSRKLDIVHSETLKPSGSFLFKAASNEVSRCAIMVVKGKHDALPEMNSSCVEEFLNVISFGDRVAGILWAKPKDCAQLAEVERAVWGDQGATEECLQSRLNLNQHGTIMAVDIRSSQCLGFLTQVPIPEKWAPPYRSWSELASLAIDCNHFLQLKKHKQLVSFGVSIACLPSSPHGLASHLFKTIASRLDQLGCRSFIGGIRMIGLRSHLAAGGTIQTYFEGLEDGRIYNPIYGAVVEAGGKIFEPMSDYYGDIESKDFGLKIEIYSSRSSGDSE